MPGIARALELAKAEEESAYQLAKGRLRPHTTAVGRFVARREGRVASRIGKALRRHRVAIAAKAAAAYGSRAQKLAKASDDDVVAAVMKILRANYDDLAEEIIRILRPEILDAYQTAGRAGLEQVGFAATEAMVHQVDAEAVFYAANRGGELMKDYADTTDEAVRGLLSRAVEEGMSADDLSSAIEELGAFGPARADMIARTELAFAHVQGNVEGWRATGEVEGKRWILADTHPEPDECDDAAEAGVVDLEDDFGDTGIDFPPAHPNCLCLAPSTIVWGPEVRAATRSLYEGEVVVIRTASGNELTVTPDHPILTDNGFVAADRLHQGDSVISSSEADAIPWPYKDKQDRPSRAEEIFNALAADGSVSIAGGIVTADLDKKACVINAKIRPVLSNAEAPLHQHSGIGAKAHELTLMRKPRPRLGKVLDALCGVLSLPPILGALVGGCMRSLDLRRALAWDCVTPPSARLFAMQSSHFRTSAPFNPSLRINDAQGARKHVGAVSRPAGLTDDLQKTLPAAIFSDKVVSIGRRFFEGHVYNFQTVDGWYCASGIIAHNCDVLPVLRKEDWGADNADTEE
jgi:hypothetical protein